MTRPRTFRERQRRTLTVLIVVCILALAALIGRAAGLFSEGTHSHSLYIERSE